MSIFSVFLPVKYEVAFSYLESRTIALPEAIETCSAVDLGSFVISWMNHLFTTVVLWGITMVC